LKCDDTRAENRFRLSTKRTSPFKSAGASVQSTTGSRGVRISGSNGGYTMFRGSVKGTGYPLHSPVSPSLPLSCVTLCRHISTGLYLKSTENVMLRHRAHRSIKASVLSKCHTISRCTTKCEFFYANNKTAAFPMPIFSKRYYLQNSSTKLHLGRKINVGDMDRNYFRFLSKSGCHYAVFRKFIDNKFL
jgi:hypothetical protein